MKMSSYVFVLMTTLLLLIFAQESYAQSVKITGIVRDSISLEPIDGMVIQAIDNNKVLAFDISQSDGSYKLSFESKSANIQINFRHLAFHEKVLETTNKSKQVNVSLSTKNIQIREVVVKAPEVIQKKDTVSFNVAAFQGAGDRSIEDVIKKLPGVEVSESGEIAYQGKAISQFNIEGLDMLGGKYSLATKNIEAKAVNRVEVMENFQHIKQLQGKEYSDKVAMNLKLKKEAIIKPMGALELGAGYSPEEWLYHAGINAMAFKSKYQFMGIVKGNNLGESLRPEFKNHFGTQSVGNTANSLFSGELASHPPIASKLFWRKDEIISSLNSIVKLNENKTLRMGVDFLRDKSFNNSVTASSYYLNNEYISLQEELNPHYDQKRIQGNVNYQVNSNKIYLSNSISFGSEQNENQFFLKSNDDKIQQMRKNNLRYIQNGFSLFKRTGKRQYNISSSLAYSSLPSNQLLFIGVKNVASDFHQTSIGNTFSTTNSLSFGHDLGKLSRLSISVSFAGNYDNISTRLQRNDSSFINHNSGYKLVSTVSPSYTIFSPSQRYEIDFRLPLSLYNLNFKNDVMSDNFMFDKAFFNPALKGHLILTPKLKMEFSSGLYHGVGDIGEFILQPIQTSYRHQQVRTGILAQNRAISSNLKLIYKNPIELFFADASVGYNHNQRNSIANQQFGAGQTSIDMTTVDMAYKNVSQGFSTGAYMSKHFRSIKSTVSVRGNYGVGFSQSLRQNVMTDVGNHYFSVSPSVSSDIFKKLNITYSLNYTQNTQVFGAEPIKYHDQSHAVNLSYQFVKNFTFLSTWDYSRRELAPKNYKNMHLFDCALRYKNKKYELELKATNLLNLNEYAYTIFSEVDQFSYQYKLRPRELMTIVKFNF